MAFDRAVRLSTMRVRLVETCLEGNFWLYTIICLSKFVFRYFVRLKDVMARWLFFLIHTERCQVENNKTHEKQAMPSKCVVIGPHQNHSGNESCM